MSNVITFRTNLIVKEIPETISVTSLKRTFKLLDLDLELEEEEDEEEEEIWIVASKKHG